MTVYRRIRAFFRNGVVLYYRARGVEIGNGTMISRGAWIDTHRDAKVVIGSRCVVSNGCKILAHDWAKYKMGLAGRSEHFTTTVLEDGVFVGMNSIVLPGVRVGRDAIIGAGAVVTRDVPQATLVAGNPARPIRRLDPGSGVWIPLADCGAGKG